MYQAATHYSTLVASHSCTLTLYSTFIAAKINITNLFEKLNKLVNCILKTYIKNCTSNITVYAIVDIETTGGHASSNGITEIAVYVHDGEKIIEHFETLINPEQKIPAYITALTGINNYTVADAPTFKNIADKLFSILQNNIFVAHNVNFDYSFIKNQLKNHGYDLTAKKLCTVRLGRKLFPGFPSYSLGNICRALNIPIDNRHRAGGDARATVLLFEHYLKNQAQPVIEQMLKKSSGEQWLPLHLDKTVITKLPNTPGVYYFYNQKDKIVYIGKAINIRQRVTSHFTQNDSSRKRQNFVRNIFKISYKECVTELEALVLENVEIKKYWPKYNISLKKPEQKYALYQFEDGKGYMRLAIDKKKKNVPALYHFNLLHEGMVLLKNMKEEFDLHEKLCFIDKTPFTESDYEFLDSPKKYNNNVLKAVAELELRLPTFAVIDTGKTSQENLCLFIERGSFWGMGYISSSIKKITKAYLKETLQPYRDDDYIRNNIYSFVETYPEKRVEIS